MACALEGLQSAARGASDAAQMPRLRLAVDRNAADFVQLFLLLLLLLLLQLLRFVVPDGFIIMVVFLSLRGFDKPWLL